MKKQQFSYSPGTGNLQRIPDEIDIKRKVEMLVKILMVCVEDFAPEKNIALNKRPLEWITNQI